MKRALVTGITGQSGSYLAELLLSKGYDVWGLVRRTSTTNTQRIDQVLHRLHLVIGDMSDPLSLVRAIEESQPDEIYNLAAQSQVLVSYQMPEYTADVVGIGPTRILEILRSTRPATRFYQASTSELYGKVVETPQTERTPFHPRSPYATAKAQAFHATRNFREAYGLFTVNGILFNHESPRRGEEFVTRKITRAATRIKMGLQDRLKLGNLDSKRDWGFAGDYVEAMWLMLQAETPDDYVIATGVAHSVREFVEMTFEALSLDWQKYVEYDEDLLRPAEVDYLCGDASKARAELGWSPKVALEDLVKMMVESDLDLACREARK
jgi:GDPmannose 4,6-dehydratase